MRQWRDGLMTLPPFEQAEAFAALMDYALDGKPYTGSNGAVKMFFAMATKQIDEHNAKYAEICEKRSRSANARWKNPKDANASESTQMQPNASESTQMHTDNDNDCDNDCDNVHVIDEKNNTPNGALKEKPEPSSAPIKFIFKKALIERGCNDQIASDYMALRNRRKAPSTITAFERIEREANKYMAARPDSTFEDVVRLMIEHNWLGFEAAWVKDTATAQPEISEHTRLLDEQIRRQRELDAEIDAERQRRKKAAEAEANNNK